MPKYIEMVYNSELIVRDSEKLMDLTNKSLDLIFRNPPHKMV